MRITFAAEADLGGPVERRFALEKPLDLCSGQLYARLPGPDGGIDGVGREVPPAHDVVGVERLQGDAKDRGRGPHVLVLRGPAEHHDNLEEGEDDQPLHADSSLASVRRLAFSST